MQVNFGERYIIKFNFNLDNYEESINVTNLTYTYECSTYGSGKLTIIEGQNEKYKLEADFRDVFLKEKNVRPIFLTKDQKIYVISQLKFLAYTLMDNSYFWF